MDWTIEGEEGQLHSKQHSQTSVSLESSTASLPFLSPFTFSLLFFNSFILAS